VEPWGEHERAAAPVVVIGAGPAGLAVAARAEDALLLEASSRVGGRAGLSRMMFWLAGTATQSEQGIEDSPEQAAEDWVRITGSPPTEATLRFLEDGAWIHDDLEALGLRWATLSHDPMTEVRRLHGMGDEADFTDYLADALPPSVRLYTDSPVSRVILEHGRAVGVEVEGEAIPARAVVIATGGFVGNSERLARVVDGDVAWGPALDGGAIGDALAWAEQQGWGTDALGAIGWFRRYVSTSDGPVELHDSTGVMPWIWIDGHGERFTDESEIETVTTGTPCLEHAPVWGLSPRQAMIEALTDADDLDRAMDLGEVRCLADAASVAEDLGLSPETLEATLEQTREAAQAAVADRFGRNPGSFPDFDDELCVYELGLVAQKNFGGLAVDSAGRVLDKRGQVVPGLWAAGEAAGMAMPGLGGRSGFDGALSAVVWSGWRVGEALRQEP
jgi:urocanate reductase